MSGLPPESLKQRSCLEILWNKECFFRFWRIRRAYINALDTLDSIDTFETLDTLETLEALETPDSLDSSDDSSLPVLEGRHKYHHYLN